MKASNSINSLHHFATLGDINGIKQISVELLKEHIEDVNQKGYTPLFCAAIGGQKEVMKYLLEQGADPSAFRKGAMYYRPIYQCWSENSRNEHKDIVEVLAIMAEKKPSIAGNIVTIIDNPQFGSGKNVSAEDSQQIMQFKNQIRHIAMEYNNAIAIDTIDVKERSDSPDTVVKRDSKEGDNSWSSYISSIVQNIFPSSSPRKVIPEGQPLLDQESKKNR